MRLPQIEQRFLSEPLMVFSRGIACNVVSKDVAISNMH